MVAVESLVTSMSMKKARPPQLETPRRAETGHLLGAERDLRPQVVRAHLVGPSSSPAECDPAEQGGLRIRASAFGPRFARGANPSCPQVLVGFPVH